MSNVINIQKEGRKATNLRISTKARDKVRGMGEMYINAVFTEAEKRAVEGGQKTILPDHIPSMMNEDVQTDLVDILIGRMDKIEEALNRLADQNTTSQVPEPEKPDKKLKKKKEMKDGVLF